MQTIQSAAIPMCISAIDSPLPVRALVTTTYTNGVSSSFYQQIINDQSTVSNISTMTAGTVIADPFYVAWEAKDLSLFPVAYATSLASQIGVAFTPTATPKSASKPGQPANTRAARTGNADADADADASHARLSTAAKIGLGAGVGVGVALIAALLAALLFIRRLKRRNKAAAAAASADPDETTPAMHAGNAVGAGPTRKWYHDSRTDVESPMEMQHGVNELDAGSGRRPAEKWNRNGAQVNELDSIPVQAFELPGESVQKSK
ncbi:hypothetical protein ACEQ8H_003077 [Pleosporales sp. CAS-2024a]